MADADKREMFCATFVFILILKACELFSLCDEELYAFGCASGCTIKC